MKLRIIVLTTILAFLAIACSKDDFNDLRHPIVVEGDFDPVYGFPIASMSADMGTIIGMLDTNPDVSIYIGKDEVVAIRYSYHNHTQLQWEVENNDWGHRTKEGRLDTIRQYAYIHGTQYIDLFKKIQDLEIDHVGMDVLRVTATTFLKAYASSSLQHLVDQGVDLAFDSIHVAIRCKDGHREELPIMPESEKVAVSELVEGKSITILDQHDIWGVVKHKPLEVEYTVRMCLGIPVSHLWTLDPTQPVNYLDSIEVDSIAADFDAEFDMPLKFFCKELSYGDTLEIDNATMAGLMDSIHNDTLKIGNFRMTLNDTNSYIALATDNYLPLEVTMNIEFQDEDHRPLASAIMQGDRTIYGAPVVPVEGENNVYRASGCSSSLLKIRLDMQSLKEIFRAKYVAYHLMANTSLLGTTTPKPNVSILQQDRIDMRTYIVFSPHTDFSIPLIPNLIKRDK